MINNYFADILKSVINKRLGVYCAVSVLTQYLKSKDEVEFNVERVTIFFLEDSLDRYAKFFKWIETKAEKPNITSATDAEEAIKILEESDHFDVIFLDHDLGGRIFVDSSEDNTGYQVAKFIKQKGITYNQLIIHSQNPQGANNMKNILPDGQIIPFPELMRS